MEEVKYKDIATSFAPNPSTGDLSLVREENAIKQSIKNLIFMSVYEPPFDDMFTAGGVYDLLFETFTPMVESQIRDKVKTVVEDYEPRVTLIDVLVRDLPQESALTIKIIFRAKTSVNDISFDVFLKRSV